MKSQFGGICNSDHHPERTDVRITNPHERGRCSEGFVIPTSLTHRTASVKTNAPDFLLHRTHALLEELQKPLPVVCFLLARYRDIALELAEATYRKTRSEIGL